MSKRTPAGVPARGRRRRVRVVEAGARTVVVDTNPRWAGRALELEVQLIDILTGASEPDPQRILAFDVDPKTLKKTRTADPTVKLVADEVAR